MSPEEEPCPTCGATYDEDCTTPDGRDHKSREPRHW